MSTLITAGNSEGVWARCDAKCHDAEHPKCGCICGGLYHGARAQGGQEELDRRQVEQGGRLMSGLVADGRLDPVQASFLPQA